MKEFLRVNDVARQLSVSTSMVRVYANKGQLNHRLTPSGQRVFSQQDVNDFLGVSADPEETIVFYTRSNNGNKELLNAQKELLTATYGTPLTVVMDNGSGLNENRKGLVSLMEQAKQGKFSILCVTEKDRLTRFGFRYLEEFFSSNGVTVRVLSEKTEKTLNEELLQDFMSLIASFSGKFYRLRGYEQKKQLLRKAGEILEQNKETA